MEMPARPESLLQPKHNGRDHRQDRAGIRYEREPAREYSELNLQGTADGTQTDCGGPADDAHSRKPRENPPPQLKADPLEDRRGTCPPGRRHK